MSVRIAFRDGIAGGACPTFFRACCVEASRQSAHGVVVGYDHPGYQLMSHVERLGPYEIEYDEWELEIEILRNSVEALDDNAVLEWFCRWFPRCMAIVPKRRRRNFLKGVYRCAVYKDWLSEDEIEAGR